MRLFLVCSILGLVGALSPSYYAGLLTLVLVYGIFAMSLNVLVGYTGLVSFGHAAFFGTAAYVAGHAAKVWGLPFEACLLVGVAASAAVGAVFGYLSIRRQGQVDIRDFCKEADPGTSLGLFRGEELLHGLGARSTRHVMTRADLLVLEVMVHLAEGYQRRYEQRVNPPQQLTRELHRGRLKAELYLVQD